VPQSPESAQSHSNPPRWPSTAGQTQSVSGASSAYRPSLFLSPADHERQRYLLELLDTLAKTIERQVRRLEQQGQEDRETLGRILAELTVIAAALAPPSTAVVPTGITFTLTSTTPSAQPAQPPSDRFRLTHPKFLSLFHRSPSTPTTTNPQGESPMSLLPPVAGNTLVYTGTLSPAGATFPTDTVFKLTSSDPTVSPTLDPTGLIVTIPLPSTFVDNPSSPFSVTYSATSASTGMNLSATITPTVPTVVPSSISFVQTT
jgi:hypothetical protein